MGHNFNVQQQSNFQKGSKLITRLVSGGPILVALLIMLLSTSARAQETQVAGNSDLAVSITPESSNVIIGHNAKFNITVTNNGPDATSATLVTFNYNPVGWEFISAEGNGYNDSVYSTFYWDRISLAANQSVNFSATLRALEVGSQGLTAQVRTFSEIVDPNNNNNSAIINVEIAPANYDLIASLTLSPAKAQLGDLVTMSFSLTNTGPENATSISMFSPMAYNLADFGVAATGIRNFTFTSDDPWVMVSAAPLTLTLAELGAGETATWTAVGTLSSFTPDPKEFYAFVNVDSPNVDNNIDNNIAEARIPIGEPDPVIETPDPETPVCSETVELSATIDKLKVKGKYKKKKDEWQYKVNGKVMVGNSGVECSPPTNVFLYLSDDPILDGSDILLATKTIKIVCPGKKAKKAKFKLKLNAMQNPYGRYFIAVADGDNIVLECNEADNAAIWF